MALLESQLCVELHFWRSTFRLLFHNSDLSCKLFLFFSCDEGKLIRIKPLDNELQEMSS